MENTGNFNDLPDDWHIIVCDIERSTEAVNRGFHNEVNLAATGSIIVVLNGLKTTKVKDIPYFFGGDGATFLVPQSILETMLNILYLHQSHVQKTFHCI